MLVRGKLHVEVLSADFPGEQPRGIEEAVNKIPGILNLRFPNDASKPNLVMSDRGPAFYHGTGTITEQYSAALRQNGLRPLMGADARMQPGNLQELMLHETAIAWLRFSMSRCVPKQPWHETREEYSTRLKETVRKINANHDVHNLCKGFPKRLSMLIEKEGDRISK